MKLPLLVSLLVLASTSHAAVFTEDSLDSAQFSLAKKPVSVELDISEKDSMVAEATEKVAAKGMLAQKTFADSSIKGYACNISHTPSEANKWSIILYNFSDPSDDGEVVFSTNKNRKIQSVACLPNGEKLIFSYQESVRGDTEIYSLDLTTNEVLRLTDNDTDDSDVTISQDGKVLAWQNRLADGRQAITVRTYNDNGSEFTEKSLASANPFVQPSLSANGRWLALVQLRTNTFLALRYDLMNSAFKTIYSIPRRKRLFNPSISDDGNIYSWVENKALSRYVVKNISENTVTRLITGVEGIEHPFLSQSGESVIYSIGGQTLIKNIRTGITEEVAFAERYVGSYWMGEPEPPKLSGSWKLPGRSVILHFLPDGRYFAKQWEQTDNNEGFEYGKYVASDSEITFTTLENHDGDALTCGENRGVSCGVDGMSSNVWEYSLTANTLGLIPPDEYAVFTLDRIEPTSSPIDGLWESLDAKEIIYFTGGDSYFYINYLGDTPSDEIIFDLGQYTITSGESGSGDITLKTTHTYNYENYGPVCEQTGSTPCERFNLGFSLVNGQLYILNADDGDRGVFTQLLVDDGSPADTGTLIAQKDYAKDLEANQNYGIEIDDDYRTRIRTVQQPGTQASMFSTKITIDDASTLVREDGANIQARLTATYVNPDNNMAIDIAVRLRSEGGSAVGDYTMGTCFDEDCDDELYLSGRVNGLGEFTGDHEMDMKWNAGTKEFVYTIDGTEIGRIAMTEFAQDPRVIAAGGYTFDPADYVQAGVYADIYNIGVGESAYIAVHVDEVSIDGAVYDDFKNGLIDISKWRFDSYDR
ncbi:TolB family protein [Leucothrix mucor]|uniref:TolB family protein n=1 Tax=Leucothrix mucor TaxID=45248 RepID=UPI0003B4F3E0|nr:hypothetical protein [Leucothrix mucor]